MARKIISVGESKSAPIDDFEMHLVFGRVGGTHDVKLQFADANSDNLDDDAAWTNMGSVAVLSVGDPMKSIDCGQGFVYRAVIDGSTLDTEVYISEITEEPRQKNSGALG